MALTTTVFVEHGRFSCFGSSCNRDDGSLVYPCSNDQQTCSFTNTCVWRFRFSRQAGMAANNNGALFSLHGSTCNLADHARSRSRGLWGAGTKLQPPADRPGLIFDGAPDGAASEQLGNTGRYVSLVGARGDAPRPWHANLEPGNPTSALSSTGVSSCARSMSPHHVKMQGLVASTKAHHASDRRMFTTESLPVAVPSQESAMHSPPETLTSCAKNMNTCANQSFRNSRGGEDKVESLSNLCCTHSPLVLLRAACLASVAVALVHLPRAWTEQAQALQGFVLRSWSLNPHLGRPAAQTPMQSPQLQQYQIAQSGKDALMPGAAEVTPKLSSYPQPSSLHNSRAAGTRLGLSPASLACASDAATSSAIAVSASSASQVEAYVGLVYTVDQTEQCCNRSSSKASCEATVTRRDWVSTEAAGSEPATARPQQLAPSGHSQLSHDQAGCGEDAVGLNEEAQELKRPTAFDKSIRYCKLLFAGAMSAVVSRTCVAPLERVKMDVLLKNGTGDAFTTAAQVLRTEGIGGFWKGNALNVLRTAPFKAVNFFSFEMYHTAFMALSGRDENFERFLAGACAGVTATLVCFPLDVVRTRLMASVVGPRYGSGPFNTLAGILRNEGAAALYSGCLPAVIGMAPAGAVFYGVYDLLKHQHLERLGATSGRSDKVDLAAADLSTEAKEAAVQQPLTLDPLHTLLYGAMAGAASELIVYPLEVIRRKMQLQSMALANLRQSGGLHPHSHHHLHGPSFGVGGASSGAAAASGRLAAAAHHHHMLPYHLGAQKMMSILSAATVANSPGLARVAAAVTAILGTDGPRGFYSGLLPNMLQVLPSAALSYYTYDTLKTVLGAR